MLTQYEHLQKEQAGSNFKSSWPSWRWWVTILLLLDDHPGDGVQPYCWDSGWPSWWWWSAFLGLVGHKPLDAGLPSWGWGLTILGIIWDHYLENRWPSFGRLVTIFWMVDDHPYNGGWPSWGWWVTIYGSCHLTLFLWVKSNCQIPSLQYTSWVTILGLVGDHPRDDRWLVLWAKYKYQNPSL